MTFDEWLADLLNPARLTTEGIYNITFEIVATWIFVRFLLGKLIKKEIEKHEAERKQDGE